MHRAWARAFHSSMIIHHIIFSPLFSLNWIFVSMSCSVFWIYKVFYIIDLEEVALPLDEYASLREFFVRSLKEGCRPIDPDLQCLVTGNQHLEHLIILKKFQS